MIDLERALIDPQSIFEVPNNVVINDDISTEQKIEILRQWEYDARALEVAEEENMSGDSPDLLSAVLKALQALGVESGTDDHDAPTKHGGHD